METRLTEEMMAALVQPFAAAAIQWKPGATNHDKTRGLALAYVDLRHYIDRLTDVAGADWSDDYEVQDNGKVVLCRLTVAGVTRSDVGEAEPGDENTATIALAQAFKRACVKFGLGAYLYRLPRRWIEYDAERKRFTDAALAQQQRGISSGKSSPPKGVDRNALNLKVTVPAGEHAGKPLSWVLNNDRPYLERIAGEAQDADLREAAQAVLDNGHR